MMFNLKVVVVICCVVLLAACAGKQSKFSKIYPGMTADDVAKTMGKGPNSVEPFKEGYASWHYGEDRCLLLKDDKVVAKDETTTKGSVDTPWGGAKERKLAQCVPPDQPKSKKIEREIETPFGTIKR